LYRASEVRVISRQAIGAVYALALVLVVVGLDVFFFKHRAWERRAANVGIVLGSGAFYFRFLHTRYSDELRPQAAWITRGAT
jgi:hypothetical protein